VTQSSPANGKRPSVLMLLHASFPTEVRVAAEVRAAVAAGFDVDVIALRDEGKPAFEEAEGARVFRLPVSHERGPGVLGAMQEYFGFLFLAAAKAARLTARRRYDVVQVHNPPDFLIGAAAIPRLFGARVLLDVHDLATDMFEMRFAGTRGADTGERVLRRIEKWALRRADAIVTVHEPYRQVLIERGASPDKVTVVLNTLDRRVFPPRAAVTTRDTFEIVYHGTITPQYGVQLLPDALVDVLPRVRDASVRIYGEGDAVETVLDRARELEVDQHLEVVRHLPQREVLQAIQGASVGVVPNLPTRLNQFALSTKLFEYVVLGIPVVCADLPTIRSYFSPDEVLFFEAGNPSDLARRLTEVAEDPAAATRRSEAALRRYEAYEWEINESRYLGVLRRLASRRRGH
jgi:glycosyltransferase involved in cell wall biosynthesis